MHRFAVALAVPAALLAAVCACPAPARSGEPALPQTVPADFTIRYENGPVAADWADARFLLLAPARDGSGGFRLTIGHVARDQGPNGQDVIEREVVVSNAQALRVYQEVVRRDFFHLEASYHDPRVLDGGVEDLRVTAGGRSKWVTVANLDLPPFDAVAHELHVLAK